ncbi:hypothetical protein [Sagittula sp. S175]|uniref:hypothetical protein n=1 Tax=Sagittula sp. S175 TaxID=3415129 RepID=UPI003C7CC624
MNLDDLLTLVVAYCLHVDRSEATVSNQITTHARLFKRLRSGHGCNVNTYNTAMAWFSTNWPEDLEWPKGVERPKVQAKRGAA